MKKVLFALSLAAAFSFVACNGKSDCVCNIYASNGTVLQSHTGAVNNTLDISDFDGDCKDATWSDLPDTTWTSMQDVNATLKCEDK